MITRRNKAVLRTVLLWVSCVFLLQGVQAAFSGSVFSKYLQLPTLNDHSFYYYYSPHLASWITTDPIGKKFQAGDINLYRYVGNGVTGGVDLWGLDWKTIKKLGQERRTIDEELDIEEGVVYRWSVITDKDGCCRCVAKEIGLTSWVERVQNGYMVLQEHTGQREAYDRQMSQLQSQLEAEQKQYSAAGAVKYVRTFTTVCGGVFVSVPGLQGVGVGVILTSGSLLLIGETLSLDAEKDMEHIEHSMENLNSPETREVFEADGDPEEFSRSKEELLDQIEVEVEECSILFCNQANLGDPAKMFNRQ